MEVKSFIALSLVPFWSSKIQYRSFYCSSLVAGGPKFAVNFFQNKDEKSERDKSLIKRFCKYSIIFMLKSFFKNNLVLVKWKL